MANLAYSRLGGSTATFQQMIKRFGVVTVMNARVYETSVTLGNSAENVETIVKKVLQLDTNGNVQEKTGVAPLCRLDTLKIANATQEGPTKTVSGGQYSNPLIKFGKSMRLEMQDALGNAAALDALCGTVSESGASYSDPATFYASVGAVHVTEDFNGPKTIIGDTFFIDQKTGQQVKALIVFFQFLPDSIFNLTQDAEGDATVFDMNGDVLTTNILIDDQNGNEVEHGVFYTILDPAELASA